MIFEVDLNCSNDEFYETPLFYHPPHSKQTLTSFAINSYALFDKAHAKSAAPPSHTNIPIELAILLELCNTIILRLLLE